MVQPGRYTICSMKTGKPVPVGVIQIDAHDNVTYLTLNGLLSARKRLDGAWGFESLDGNDSRVCKAEAGVVGRAKPSPEQIKKIYKNMKEPEIVETEEYVECDGFRMIRTEE